MYNIAKRNHRSESCDYNIDWKKPDLKEFIFYDFNAKTRPSKSAMTSKQPLPTDWKAAWGVAQGWWKEVLGVELGGGDMIRCKN